MKTEFKVGDRVKLVDSTTSNFYAGDEGVIKYLSNTRDNLIAVEFEKGEDGHSCGGHTKEGRGWWCCPGMLELLPTNAHYNTAVQPIEVMQANMSQEELIGFLRGNIIKYACRYGKKDDVKKEAAKIKQYAEWLVDILDGKTIDPRK